MAHRDSAAHATNPIQFTEFQSRLIELREELERRIADARVNIDQQQAQTDPGDIGDHSVIDTDQDYYLTLADRERHELAEIQEALERLTRGSYGECQACEEPIAVERLRSLPFTRMCIDCSAAAENERLHNRPQALPKL